MMNYINFLDAYFEISQKSTRLQWDQGRPTPGVTIENKYCCIFGA